MKQKVTYKKAGVDITIADETKKEIAESLVFNDSRVLNGIGPFASLFEASFPNIKDPVLVLKSEEPGSKQYLSIKYNKISEISYDLINHLINDIIVMGATPLAVLDTIICGKLDKNIVVNIVKSIANACREQSCTLVGGETSEQPGVIPQGTFVLCASIIGIVNKANIIDGSKIKEGDTVIGVKSNGLHTNGYSLIRHLIDIQPDLIYQKIDGMSFLDIILKPHMCYYKGLRDLLNIREIHGIAHITGGGIASNLSRIIPKGLCASVDLSKLQMLPVFKFIRNIGNIPDFDMLRTFNMGIGIILVVSSTVTELIHNHLSTNGYFSYPIGEIKKGNQRVNFIGNLKY